MKDKPNELPSALEKLYDLVVDEETLRREFGHYFYNYLIKSMNFYSKPNILKFSRNIDHVLHITNGRGTRILDAGCGYGIVPIFMALLGAKEVYGIDQDEQLIEVFKKLLDKLDLPNVHPIKGDVLELDRYFDEEYFDVVIARESISHIGDTDEFISQVFKALKMGGGFYIKDSNNSLDLIGRYKRRLDWKKVEEGPGDPDERPPYNVPYREIRRRMIEERFPELEHQRLEKLSKETAGLFGEEIYQAVKGYIDYSKIPNKPSLIPRHPLTGALCEKEFNPYTLKARLNKVGFKTEVIPPFFSPLSKIKKVAALILRKSHPLSLLILRRFDIISIKEG